jgi:hypothetical protein
VVLEHIVIVQGVGLGARGRAEPDPAFFMARELGTAG